ncbi:hypothetical protein RND71_043867 [Anisodus tanguticus]|uniref:alanine--glyoxylate transaminase n=1 Tax=Anisodus tanguticus TaxID=243964 RepID=A0AAE1QQ98_9SOLA|nr:hypothetical protein RND71_043867 [Anisodus tanguticus]
MSLSEDNLSFNQAHLNEFSINSLDESDPVAINLMLSQNGSFKGINDYFSNIKDDSNYEIENMELTSSHPSDTDIISSSENQNKIYLKDISCPYEHTNHILVAEWSNTQSISCPITPNLNETKPMKSIDEENFRTRTSSESSTHNYTPYNSKKNVVDVFRNRSLSMGYNDLPKFYYLPKPFYMDLTLEEVQVGTYSDIELSTMDTKLIDVMKKLVDRRISALPIVDENGSEANELAVMIARLHTQANEIVSLQNCYHGCSPTTLGLNGIGEWKHKLLSSFGIHHVINPDVYRGKYGNINCRDSMSENESKCKNSEQDKCCSNYVKDFESLINDFIAKDNFAAFIVESIQGVGGTVQYPRNYLKQVSEIVKKNKGLLISDEVQTGFGRTGKNFWGFQNHGIKPDIGN